MPLQRRLPKIGFSSAMKASRAELTLDDLVRVSGGEVTLAALIAASLVPENTMRVKIILSGASQPSPMSSRTRPSPRPRAPRARSSRPAAGSRHNRLRHGHLQRQCRRGTRRHDALCGDAQASVVPAGCARRLSGRHLHPGARHRCRALRRVLLDAAGHAARHVQHVLGRCAAAVQHFRAQRDALHHRVDHRANGLDGVSAVGADPQGRRIGAAQADAVHALRHGVPRRFPGLRRRAGDSELRRQSGARIRARSSCSSRPSRSPPARCSSCGWASRSPSAASATASR